MSEYQKHSSASVSSIQSVERGVHSVTKRYLNDSQLNQQQPFESSVDNICGRTLLTLVARGSAIITELHRLIELVPSPYRHTHDSKLECDSLSQFLDKEKQFTVDDLISDFSYFKNAESFEAKIESNESLKKADENFCDNFIDILSRFYLTFESIQRYATDLNNFIAELEEETFVGQSLEGLLLDVERRQLISEAYFLLGFMLITTDNNFEGSLRERLIVSYYRYSSYKSSPSSSLEDTCNLMRSTGFRSPSQQLYRTTGLVSHHRPDGYPEIYFQRVGVNQSVVNLLIAKLQIIDIYNQTIMAFPHPEHRSTALSQQAAMLYVILYFCPSILHSQRSRMREIADKFFYDNWVISIYMGELVNLIEAWDPYKAARESLIQLLEIESTKNLVNQYSCRFNRVSKQLQDYLREGWLNADSILEHNTKILNHIREANVTLKWMLLHSQVNTIWQLGLTKVVYSIVIQSLPDRATLYKFLQNLSTLELKFGQIYDQVLVEKVDRIQENKLRASEILDEMIEMLNDTKFKRWIQSSTNSQLVGLLVQMSSNLSGIKFDGPGSRDSIISLINKIESAQDSYLDGKNMQIVQMFMFLRESLIKILRHLSLTHDIKILLHAISDFSYAWKIMRVTFTTHIQQIIKDDPLKVYGIESCFLKLASAFDSLLIRIHQVNSQADLISVSRYYSTKLVSYIRDVLHIIPATILELVSSTISIQTENAIGDMPSKVSLDSLKDYALPEKRFNVLELTYKVSHYAESMLMMQDTTIGLIRINSKQLLEDGIRRELVKKMSDSIQEILQFTDNSGNDNNSITHTTQTLLTRLTRLDVTMSSYRRSFEYMQDYLCIYGLRMWQEELSRITKFNVEQVNDILLNESLRGGYQSPISDQRQSLHQSSKAPIPIYSPDPAKSSFMWRILIELLKVTNPRETIYDEQMSAWYGQKAPRDKIADLKVFELIASSLCSTGLNGLDQICCTLLMLELQTLDTYLISLVTDGTSQSGLLTALNSVVKLSDISACTANHAYTTDSNKQTKRVFASALIKIAPHSERIVKHLLRIGQLQAIRSSISCVLSTKCRCEARNLYNCLDTLNSTLLATLKHCKKIDSQQKFGSHERNLSTVNAYADEATSLPGSELKEAEEDSQSLDDSQLLFELTNHLEWIGLSDPLRKVYTLELDASPSSQVYEFRQRLVAMDLIFLILLDQCSKFQFSRSISGFVPKQSRSFYDTTHTVDGQPLFYGLMTLIYHYQPSLLTPSMKHDSSIRDDSMSATSACDQHRKEPLIRLLENMSFYVKCSLDQGPTSGPLKPHELTLEVGNMILSMIELSRLAKQPASELLAKTFLPQYILDTFQFTVGHLNSTNGS